MEDAVNVVDAEIRTRTTFQMMQKFGPKFKVTDAVYNAFLKLAKMVGMDPLVYTYTEIDHAIQKAYEDWYAKTQAAEARQNLVRRKPL